MNASSTAGDVPTRINPPLDVIDGSRARAEADDSANWVAMPSQDGHPFWFPPELVYLAHGMDMSWTSVAGRLQLVLLIRQAQVVTQRLEMALKDIEVLRNTLGRKGRPTDTITAALTVLRAVLLEQPNFPISDYDRGVEVMLARQGRTREAASKARHRIRTRTRT